MIKWPCFRCTLYGQPASGGPIFDDQVGRFSIDKHRRENTLRWSIDDTLIGLDSGSGPLIFDAANLNPVISSDVRVAKLPSIKSSPSFSSTITGFVILNANHVPIFEDDVRTPPVAKAYFNKFSTHVAIIDSADRVNIYDLVGGALVSTFVVRRIFDGTFSDDAAVFAGVAYGGTVEFHRTDTGQLIRRFGIGATGGTLATRPVTVGPDGQMAALNMDGRLTLVDINSGRSETSFEGANWSIASAFSTDGTRLASIQFNALWVWDTASGRLLMTQSRGAVSCLVAAYDGGYLLVSDQSAVTHIYAWKQEGEVLTTTLVAAFVAFLAPNTCPVWSHDAQRIAYVAIGANDEYELYVLQRTDLLEIVRIPLSGTSTPDIAFSSDDHWLAVANGSSTVNLYSADDGTLATRQRFPTEADSIAFGAEGQLIAVGRNSIVVWPVVTDTLSIQIEVGDFALGRYTGKYVHSLNGNRWLILAGSPAGAIWDVDTQERLSTTGFSVLGMRDVEFNADGSFLTTVKGPALVFWDSLSGDKILQYVLPIEGSELVFSPDETWIAVGGTEGEVEILRVEALGPNR